MKLKTKKIFLLTSTLLTLLITIVSILAICTGKLKLGVPGDVTEISNNGQIAILLICAISNIISIIFILKNLIAHKKKIIFLNIISLLLGTIIHIISSIINIVIVASKTKDVEEIKKNKKKKELPVLEDISKHKWYVYLIIFIALFAICYTPLLNILPIPKTKIAAIITFIAIYIIQVTGLVIPMFNELKRDFIVFKNNFKLYLGNMLPRFGIVALLYFISNISVILIVKNIPNNQENLLSLPLYLTGLLAVIIAPLTEELMFRGFIRKFIKNDILFVILSAIIFGALHILSADSLLQLLFIIPYSVLGLAFSLNYVKTKNIASNIFLHCSWNTIALILATLSTI